MAQCQLQEILRYAQDDGVSPGMTRCRQNDVVSSDRSQRLGSLYVFIFSVQQLVEAKNIGLAVLMWLPYNIRYCLLVEFNFMKYALYAKQVSNRIICTHIRRLSSNTRVRESATGSLLCGGEERCYVS